MNEIICICGESIVFLDPEVEAKSCPNCGTPVSQYDASVMAQAEFIRPERSKAARQAYWMAGFLAAILLSVGIVLGLSVARRRARVRAADEFERAQAAKDKGEYFTAMAGYEEALAIYESWGADRARLDLIEAALEETRLLATGRGVTRDKGGANQGPVHASLEDMAGYAYAGEGEAWRARFESDYAGKWVFLSGIVEERRGEAYKASSLTVSYRAFSLSGMELELSFDAPFFERYRLKAGDEFIVRAVLSRMYIDRADAGEVGHWVLVFDSAKSALVSEAAELEELGWKIDEKTEALLARQRLLSPQY